MHQVRNYLENLSITAVTGIKK